MAKASVFKSNKSQAIRLPKPVAFPDAVKSVEIIVHGRSRLVVPAGEGWDTWFNGEGVSDDFMEERDQPPAQRRDSF
jgi:antitoxin VapB